ncbi:MAG: WYL domain-containing protein [Clostridia bacterium]|nr:WYL domain-containing protein [Clostridia bacterium]
MAYSELIKNFDRIRAYMRDFYVYGFKSRDEFTKKSARSYDDERRRIESWLGDYMGFRRSAEGKNVFLSIDSRSLKHNPLYKAWKAKSFTRGDITLHFLIFDLLHDPDSPLLLSEITEEIDRRLSSFADAKTYDESSIRKKLKEYENLGLLVSEKRGRAVSYRRAKDTELSCTDALDFFSEVAPCGVIGSFLLDRAQKHESCFTFKHHYITGVLDSEILYSLFEAMHAKQLIQIKTLSRNREALTFLEVVPLRIFISVQNGRQYLMGYVPKNSKIGSFRLDNILSVQAIRECANYDRYRLRLDRLQSRMWGVSTDGREGRTERVEFTVRYNDDEEFIHLRMEREKRCGTVERIDGNTSRFTAEVSDAGELIPWIRTFIGRIVSIHFSDKRRELTFKQDLQAMYALYGVDGGETP